MSGLPDWLVPLGAFAGALLIALAVNAVLGAWAPGRDRGDLWAGVLAWSGLLMALLIGWGFTLELLRSPWWDLGWHPLFDATGLRLAMPGLPVLDLRVPVPPGPDGRPLTHPGWWALAVPFAVWLLVLLVRLALPARARAPGDPRPGAWLAGSAGFAHSRLWVLGTLVPPLLVLLLAGLADLEPGPAGTPGAVWGLMAVAAVTLIALALSGGAPLAVAAEPAAAPVPGDWPEALRRAGLGVLTLCRLEATGSPIGSVPAAAGPDGAADGAGEPDHWVGLDPAVRNLTAQWPWLAARRVAPELIEAVVDLCGDTPRNGRNRLVLAPDDAGQWESLGLAARLVRTRLERLTLIVVPDDPGSAVARLAPWLPVSGLIGRPRAAAPADPAALVWLLDVGTLSEHLADLADNPALLGRIGLTVWCDLDRYSGVMAANVWAVSHRLHRLLTGPGRRDARSLTFARHHPGQAANFAAFWTQLLPYDYGPAERVLVEARRRHPVVIHLLEPNGVQRPADPAHASHWDPSLRALRASVEAGWLTCYSPPRALDTTQVRDFLGQRLADGRPLGDHLAPGPADASARILEAGPADLLDLIDRLSQGGRALDGPPVHQVGLLLPPDYPYARHLLDELAADPGAFFRRTRHLVPGVPQPAIVRRHLLLALREQEAVASGLLDTFQWRDRILDPVLADLSHRHEVERRDVRFLDGDNRLMVDTAYRSASAEVRTGPLDTVGERLVSLIVREAGVAEALIARIDPERASILAYPRRVLRVRGQSYRVNHWPAASAEEVRRLGVLYCTRTEDPALTWRVSEPRLRRSRLDESVNPVFLDQAGLAKAVIQTHYEEEVSGLIEVRRAPDGTLHQMEPLWGEPIEGLAFPTRGLLLRFLPEDLEGHPAALHSIAQALAQVLLVQVGVEEDAVLVMAAEDLRLGSRRESGLVILDLYPQGIGLVEALYDDDRLLWRLLVDTRDWLAACPCAAEAGCPRCLQSPPALAATRHSVERRLSRREAAEVLRRVLGPEGRDRRASD